NMLTYDWNDPPPASFRPPGADLVEWDLSYVYLQVRTSEVRDRWPRGEMSDLNGLASTVPLPAAVDSTPILPQDRVPGASVPKESTTERNLRWYDRHKQLRAQDPKPTNDAVFDAISNDEFGPPDHSGTVKKAVNAIRASRGETGQRRHRLR